MIYKSLLAIAASFMTMSAFAGTVAVMTVGGGAGFPAANDSSYHLA
jgi:hypothetical protein